MVEKIKSFLSEAKRNFNDNELIVLTYNPKIETAMVHDDAIALACLLERINVKRAVVILHGQGGLFETGLIISHLLRKYLPFYTICVPSICCSSLCLPFFKADKLLIDKQAKITQVDPIFEHNGAPFRAIRYLHSDDSEKKDVARKSFSYARYHVIEMLKNKPSLFDFKNVDFEDFGHAETVVDTFMNKDEHFKEISFEELQNLDLKVDLIRNDSLTKILKALIEACQEQLIADNKRFLLAATCDIQEGVEKGNILMID